VKLRSNLPGPPGKAKYYSMTDSELVGPSEIGTAQTSLRTGVADALRSYKIVDSRSFQECYPTEGERPVDEINRSPMRGAPE